MSISDYLQFVPALLFVLALIGVAAFLARRLGLAQAMPTASRRRRLAIVEVLSLDTKRRLVLIRRDDVEHLLLLGPTSETVVERAITTDRDEFRSMLRAETPAGRDEESDA